MIRREKDNRLGINLWNHRVISRSILGYLSTAVESMMSCVNVFVFLFVNSLLLNSWDRNGYEWK